VIRGFCIHAYPASLVLSEAVVLFLAMANTFLQSVPIDSQQFIDLWALEYHKRVAERMRIDPEGVVTKARENLKRWLSDYPAGSSDAQCLEEWRGLLETRTVPELIALITEDSDEGQRLRSSTPFTGILSFEEREEIYNRHAEMATV
jgi:hypothetical protein